MRALLWELFVGAVFLVLVAGFLCLASWSFFAFVFAPQPRSR